MKKKTKIAVFLLLLNCCLTSVFAQHSNVASGGIAVGSGGTATYSVGQLVYEVDTGAVGSVSMGVQQAIEISTLRGKNDFPEISLAMKVYPNPTTSWINLDVGSYSFFLLEYQLFDLNGRLISSQKISQTETQIHFEDLPSSTYILNVLDYDKVIKKFKIIKKY